MRQPLTTQVLLALLVVAGLLCGCSQSDPLGRPVAGVSASASVRPHYAFPVFPKFHPVHFADGMDIDDLFQSLKNKLPEPANISEMNGFSVACNRHQRHTGSLLKATADKISVRSDAKLARVGAWCRDADTCVRHIAVEVVMRELGLTDRVVPSMHDPEHTMYRETMVALKAHLDRSGVAYDSGVFDGLSIDLRKEDFATHVHGSWVEDSKTRSSGWNRSIEVESARFRRSVEHIPPDPNWDREQDAKIESVAVNAKQQFVVALRSRGVASVEVLWPTATDVVWFKIGERRWEKYRRVRRGGSDRPH